MLLFIITVVSFVIGLCAIGGKQQESTKHYHNWELEYTICFSISGTGILIFILQN